MSDKHRSRTKNCILVKDDIGRAKPSCYDLPDENFAFGRSEALDLEGAREVTMHWASHVPRPKPGENVQDFRKLNKMAARDHVANAKQLKEYRVGRDVKLLPPGPVSSTHPMVIPSDVIPSFAYGRKSRPSTPIYEVIGNQYGQQYEETLSRVYDKYDHDRENYQGKQKVKMTKAAKALVLHSRDRRTAFEPAPPKELFKLSKFKKVPSRLKLAPLGYAQSMPNLHAASQVQAMDEAQAKAETAGAVPAGALGQDLVE